MGMLAMGFLMGLWITGFLMMTASGMLAASSFVMPPPPPAAGGGGDDPAKGRHHMGRDLASLHLQCKIDFQIIVILFRRSRLLNQNLLL
jgi:hypothetical protein